jgi:hypothetical protein
MEFGELLSDGADKGARRHHVRDGDQIFLYWLNY